jgi:hypothetical protein
LGQKFSYVTGGHYAKKIKMNNFGNKEDLYFDRLFYKTGAVKEGGDVKGEYLKGRFIYDGGGVGANELSSLKQYQELSDFEIWPITDDTYGNRQSVIDPTTGELYIRTLNVSNGDYWYKFSDAKTLPAGQLGNLVSNYAYNNYGLRDSEFDQGAYYFAANTPQYKLAGYDTGGYTGDWGNEGRLAMLHQKEIVLNASDTENFLRAVEIVREIAGVIDLNA